MSEEEKKKVEEELENIPFEIEVSEEPEVKEEKEVEEEKVADEENSMSADKEFSKRVQKRISTLIQQRKQAEADTDEARGRVSSLEKRLENLEQGTNKKAQEDFQDRYQKARNELKQAIEEGDTASQIEAQEQLADMRAAMRVAEMQRQTHVQQATSPTIGRAAQVQQSPTPEKALTWWQKNRWFNSPGYERETAATRAIDVQLDLEGHDKESDEYYGTIWLEKLG